MILNKMLGGFKSWACSRAGRVQELGVLKSWAYSRAGRVQELGRFYESEELQGGFKNQDCDKTGPATHVHRLSTKPFMATGWQH